VYGTGSGAGSGIHGYTGSASGIGILAENPGGGNALSVQGPAVFSRSGTVVVPSGQKSAKVTGVPLTGSSLVLALVQNNVQAFVRAAVPDPSSSSFTVYLQFLTPVPPPPVTVGWFVVN
jgi:hypothetical protein